MIVNQPILDVLSTLSAWTSWDVAECQFQGQVRRRTRSCYNGSDKVQIEDCGTSEHQDIHICKVPLPSPVGKPTEQPQRTKKMGDLVEIDHNLDQRTNSSKTDASSRTNDTPEEDQRLFECQQELRKRKKEQDFIDAHFQVITY